MTKRTGSASMAPKLFVTPIESSLGPLLDSFPKAPLPQSMNFKALLAEAIACAQAMSSDQWTDYNEHDPGITILEQLSYALTDLGMRSQYKMEDLLADEDGSINGDTLFTGDQILTSAALTAGDYRKLIYDAVVGVKNFWLVPVKDGLPGLYHGWIEKFHEEKDEKLIGQVMKLLRANRTLGEDIVEVKVLKQQRLPLFGQIQLLPGYDADEVIGNVLFRLDFKLVPCPAFTKIDEKIIAGVPFDTIYEGPHLLDGVIDDLGYMSLPQSVSLQQITQLVCEVDGVQLLSGLRFLNHGGQTLHLAPDSVPFIDVPAANAPWSFMVFDASGSPQPLHHQRVERFFQKNRADMRSAETEVARSTDALDYCRLTTGRALNIAQYYSVQHQFPATYGLNRYGVSDSLPSQAADAEVYFGIPDGAHGQRRLAQAKQLCAYLLLFEQILANGFSQLAATRWLFSLHPPRSQQRSYFSQPLLDELNRSNDMLYSHDVLCQTGHEHPHQAVSDAPSEAQPQRHLVSVYLPAANVSQRRHVLALRSNRFADAEQARQMQRLIAERCMAKEHYEIFFSEEQEFLLVLIDAQANIIAHGQQRFATLEEATQAAARLAAHLQHAHAQGHLSRYVRMQHQLAFGMLVFCQGRVALSAFCHSLSKRSARAKAVLLAGCDSANYKIGYHRGVWGFDLYAEGALIARGQLDGNSLKQANKNVQAMATLIAHIGKEPQAYRRHVHLLPDDEDAPFSVPFALPLSPVTSGSPGDAAIRHYHRELELMVAQFDHYPKRRNTFLNHLLARFDEQFDDEALQSFDPRPANGEAFLLELASWKTHFLASYQVCSSRRACGFDYGQRGAELSSGSGFVQRMHSLLGLGGAQDFSRLASARQRLTSYQPWYGSSKKEHDGTPTFEFEKIEPDIMAMLLKYGTDLERYRITDAAHGTQSWLKFQYPNGVWRRVMAHAHKANLKNCRDRLVAWLKREGGAWNAVYEGEGLYLIEHILLRPLANEVTDRPTENTEFFSYRISVLFPAWPMRCSNPLFRQHAQALLAENCSAHLALTIHWLEFTAMQHFEQLHADWVDAKHQYAKHHHGDPTALDQHSRALREFLQQLGTTASS